MMTTGPFLRGTCYRTMFADNAGLMNDPDSQSSHSMVRVQARIVSLGKVTTCMIFVNRMRKGKWFLAGVCMVMVLGYMSETSVHLLRALDHNAFLFVEKPRDGLGVVATKVIRSVCARREFLPRPNHEFDKSTFRTALLTVELKGPKTQDPNVIDPWRAGLNVQSHAES